jgi:hypothetical protein
LVLAQNARRRLVSGKVDKMTEERSRLDWLGPPGVTFYSAGMEIIASYQGVDLVVMGHQIITLNTGGSRAPIMQNRINQIAQQLNLPLQIITRRGDWWVRTPTRVYSFVDGTELHLGPGVEEHVTYPESRDDLMVSSSRC